MQQMIMPPETTNWIVEVAVPILVALIGIAGLIWVGRRR